MIDKRWCFTISYLLITITIYSQGGFNLRIPIEGPSNIQSVYPVGDSLFICAGFSADLSGNGHLDFELLQYDYNGDQLLRKSYDHPECYGNAQENCDSEVEGFYVQFEQSIYAGQFAHRLYYFNDAIDTLFTKIVQSPYKDSLWDDAEFMYSQYAVLASDSCLFYSFGVWKPETTGNDVCIKKYSPNGEELWTYIYESDAEVDVCYALLPQDGGVIAGIFEGALPTFDKLIKLDFNGNEEWEISGWPIDSKVIHCIIEDNEEFALCGSYFADNVGGYYSLAHVFKLDTLGNLLWNKVYGVQQNAGPLEFTNIVQTCDSNYVAGGTWLSAPGSEEIIEGQNNPDYDEFAHIVKFERNSGDILWERKYRFLEIYRDQHTLVDMKATPDGGVIFCGEARDAYHIYDPPYQQGWLVKLDECGCLVPGCDTLCQYVCNVPSDTTDTTFFPVFASHFIIGPNPASDFINIYFGPSLPAGQQGLVFDIHDVQGKLVYSFVPTTTETTYMMSTEILAAGMYVISLRNGDDILQQQKVIVDK